ncbi:hypothetical protein LOTGIDRAFT_237803 [Lottia gigantea]|uniref:Uncharacterized protein n=1 Tax=Lottia gigantea TaxID=225164 RepID=V4BB18_LOTGI|nr:hypothetical protein LOTGIDRAFT_237803 [Lottia gigantea]ESP03192.1 hypothetical protein LOTGIDRAFT_237803 [Lottia gigantea]
MEASPHIRENKDEKKLSKVHNRPPSGGVEELRNKFGYNLPQIATLHRLYDRERNKHIINNIMKSQNTTPTVIKLLFTGRLPMGYFNDLCYGQATQTKKIPLRTTYPIGDRERPLWQPKPKKVISVREIEHAVYEARARHRNRLENISSKAHSHLKEVEKVMMRHLMIEPRGLKLYFDKLEKRSSKLFEKRKAEKAKHNEVTEKSKH